MSRLTSPEAVCTVAVAYRPVAMTRADAVRVDSDEPVGTVTVISIRRRRRLKPAIRSGISTVSRLPSSRTAVFSARSRAASSSGITSTVLVPVSAAVTVTVPDAARMRRSTGWGGAIAPDAVGRKLVVTELQDALAARAAQHVDHVGSCRSARRSV